MFQFCFFISIAYSYCIQTQPVQIHYSTLVERSTEMITRYEWLALQAYPDTKGWSIWYWTRSFAGEVITKAEAYRRMLKVVESGITRIKYDFPEANEDQMVALSSIYYNCWTWYIKVKKIGFQAVNITWFCLPEWYPGLIKRRAEEKRLLFGI